MRPTAKELGAFDWIRKLIVGQPGTSRPQRHTTKRPTQVVVTCARWLSFKSRGRTPGSFWKRSAQRESNQFRGKICRFRRQRVGLESNGDSRAECRWWRRRGCAMSTMATTTTSCASTHAAVRKIAHKFGPLCVWRPALLVQILQWFLFVFVLMLLLFFSLMLWLPRITQCRKGMQKRCLRWRSSNVSGGDDDDGECCEIAFRCQDSLDSSPLPFLPTTTTTTTTIKTSPLVIVIRYNI